MEKSRTLLAGLALLLLTTGCGPALEIRHRDPGHEEAEVWIDGERVDTVGYGDDERFRLDEGVHGVRVVPTGRSDSPWHAERREVRFVLDEGAVMTLLPGPPGED
ncbi:MAG: hypothetical protein ACQEXJ_05295 [Myxococcota bacterium]